MSGSRGQLGINRGEMLERVSRALGRDAREGEPPVPPRVDEGVARVVGSGVDLVEVFAKSAAASGMVVHRTAAAGVAKAVGQILASGGGGRAAIGETLPFDLRPELEAAGARVVSGSASPGFGHLYDTDVGITDVQAAVAETGSLVVCSGSGLARGLSLVPPVHIAIVKKSDIVADLIDLWNDSRIRPRLTESSNVVLITGPSKTADIEGVLITGVHGPREVHVVLVMDR
jgi:L-lactate dehydrogenase complex protein LldG